MHARPAVLSQGACRSCRAHLARQFYLRRSIARPLSASISSSVPIFTSNPKPSPFAVSHRQSAPSPLRRRYTTAVSSNNSDQVAVGNPKQDAEQKVRAIIEAVNEIPTDQAVLNALHACEYAALSLLSRKTNYVSPNQVKGDSSATGSLLSLDSRPATDSSIAEEIESLSALAFSLIEHPNVFLTAKILSAYVVVQSMLGQPESFPTVFKLYAHKATPTKSRGKIEFQPSNPNKMVNSVEPPVAAAALDVAIKTKDLFTALDIIDAAFCTTAYKKAKLLRKALVPVTGFALVPAAAYAIGTSFSQWQDTMEPGMATAIATAGIVTYVGACGTMGYVAVTTANDQMERVTWATGTPLYERWLREDERAAIDRVAIAWGFQEVWKRGEEEGEEWDFLRDWVGYRGMILDRSELMEGME